MLKPNHHKGLTSIDSLGGPRFTENRITSMLWLNEHHDALLMLGNDNGTVSIWRDTSVTNFANTELQDNDIASATRTDTSTKSDNSATLVSAFFALPDIALTSRGSG